MSSSDSESDSSYDYEVCTMGSCPRPRSQELEFDPASIEIIILKIVDKFDFRVVVNDSKVKGALLVTTGLTVAGGLIGKHYGGKIGAAVGGAIGGVCGLGIVVVSMRDIWQDIKSKLSELFEIVYDYLAGLGLDDYRKAAQFFIDHKADTKQLAMVILETASSVLGNKIISSFTPA